LCANAQARTAPALEEALVKVAVVGTGLIGASVGLAARRGGASVRGFDADPESLALAGERGAVEPAQTLADAVADAEIAVVAAPVTTLPRLVEEVLAAAPEATVTDVGSTKAAVCAAVGDARFIGGHPVAGAETQGPAHARPELFEGATWFLTPRASSDADRYRALHGFVVSLGAVPVAVDPDAHDRLLALTSHLPHALANLLLNQVGASRVEGHDPLAASGGSLRDMTRVAGANPRVWVDIFLENAEALRLALAEHRARVERLEAALAAGDAGFLARWIGEAAGNRRELYRDAYPAGDLQRVLVHIPDRPGVLAGITQALGAERINIEDFELSHMSPERGGGLAILIAGEEAARRAAELLEGQGYGVDVAPAA
jgi:prephenate dehydrogenase